MTSCESKGHPVDSTVETFRSRSEEDLHFFDLAEQPQEIVMGNPDT